MNQRNKRITGRRFWRGARMIVVVFALMLFGGLVFQGQQAEAKKSAYITNKKFRGTYGYKGKKGGYETGWYHIVLNNISSSGKVKLMLDLGGTNASPIYSTGAITAIINGNKANFKYKEDGWGNKGKGTIVFNKDGSLYLTVKETYHSEWNRSTLATSKVIFKKVSKDYKIYTNQ